VVADPGQRRPKRFLRHRRVHILSACVPFWFQMVIDDVPNTKACVYPAGIW
jgi:hypothetical protein